MNCLRQIQRFRASYNRQWQLAKKAARMEGVEYILYKKNSNEYAFVKKGETYHGTEVETIKP